MWIFGIFFFWPYYLSKVKKSYDVHGDDFILRFFFGDIKKSFLLVLSISSTLVIFESNGKIANVN